MADTDIETAARESERPRWEPPWKRARASGVTPDELLRRYEIASPPVPVELLARKMGVEVHRVRQPGWDGALQIQGNAAYIWVDGGAPSNRQRFTIAHELGHLILHDDQQMFRDRINLLGVSPKEREANNFAALLLMPTWMIHATISGRTVQEMAALFEVSEAAMNIRLQTLRLGKKFG